MNAELMRLLENILRQGVVEQISADKKAVRVRSGRLLTTMDPLECHPHRGIQHLAATLDRGSRSGWLPGRQP